MNVHISGHAIQRYQERVANIPEERVRVALDTPAVRAAVSFGCPYVRLPTGQRIVLDHGVIVTVLPMDNPVHRLRRMRGA